MFLKAAVLQQGQAFTENINVTGSTDRRYTGKDYGY